MFKNEHPDPLYLFACHLESRRKRNLATYGQLVAALDSDDCNTHLLADALLRELGTDAGERLI